MTFDRKIPKLRICKKSWWWVFSDILTSHSSNTLSENIVDLIHSKKEEYFEKFLSESLLPRDGVTEIIDLCSKRKIKLGFITSTSLKNINSIKNALIGKLDFSCFDIITSIENVKNPKFILTGNPVSRDFENLQYNRSNIDKSKFVLLIIGGSQGASVFSEVVPKAIKSLPEKIKNKIYIYQQCRESEEHDLKKIYKKLGIKFTVSNYFHKIYYQF